MGDRRSGATVKPAGGLDEQPLIPQARRDRPDKKKTKKDYERSRREKESGSLMARSLNQNKRKTRGRKESNCISDRNRSAGKHYC